MSGGAVPIIEKASSGFRDLFSAVTTSEQQYFDEERFSESQLKRDLNDNLCEKKIDAMKHILAAVSVGRDAGGLFPEVVKNIPTASIELKKLVYIYLVMYAENNRDLALLSVNSFQKDLVDRSQLVRASALRAMASIKVLEIIQLVMMAVKKAVQDGSPYVRKTAAQCITKVYSVDPDQFSELRDLLLKLLNDHDVSVVASAVMAYHHICVQIPPRLPESGEGGEGEAVAGEKAEGGEFMRPEKVVEQQLAFLHPLYKRLVQDILLMDPFAQQQGIDLLLRYCRTFFMSPEAIAKRAAEGAEGTEQEAAEGVEKVSDDFQAFVSALTLLLNSSSCGVAVGSAAALCYLVPPQEIRQVVEPLLRTLQRVPDESVHTLLVSLFPVIKGHPDLFRPWIREFFVLSFENAKVKKLKLEVLEELCVESNVQVVLKELQTYVHWHSQPEFVACSVQTIARVALKISSVADSCLRGLVKMLDSKCTALSTEAVVALRALLQQRQEGPESGLGTVIAHLAHYLEDLKAPTARASVVWIIGQYQHEVSKLAPDIVRKLAKSLPSEQTEVKQQILGVSLKVWAFHTINKSAPEPAEGPDKDKKVSPKVSAEIAPRLESLCDYILDVAAYDSNWDVRDMSRALKCIKASTKAALEKPGGGEVSAAALEDFGKAFSNTCVRGVFSTNGVPVELPPKPKSAGEKEGSDASKSGALKSQWILYSLAHILEFPFETYKAIPEWSETNSPDHIREQSRGVVEKAAQDRLEPKSLSSANMSSHQHMENRVVNPSNITNLPKAECLEDLDLFYSDEPEQPGPASVPGMPDSTSLENVGLGPAGGAVGTAVFGEDDESDEEDAKSDDGDDLKYLSQAK